MKAQFNTNILLWDNNDKGLWLDDMGYQSEDCGVFFPINIDYINYNSGDMDGRVGINGIDYSFDLEGIYDEDHDFEENPLFYFVD
jgi:hypothetical protein